MKQKNDYVSPSMTSRAIRVRTLLAGSVIGNNPAPVPTGRSVNFSTGQSIDPNAAALAKKRSALFDF